MHTSNAQATIGRAWEVRPLDAIFSHTHHVCGGCLYSVSVSSSLAYNATSIIMCREEPDPPSTHAVSAAPILSCAGDPLTRTGYLYYLNRCVARECCKSARQWLTAALKQLHTDNRWVWRRPRWRRPRQLLCFGCNYSHDDRPDISSA